MRPPTLWSFAWAPGHGPPFCVYTLPHNFAFPFMSTIHRGNLHTRDHHLQWDYNSLKLKRSSRIKQTKMPFQTPLSTHKFGRAGYSTFSSTCLPGDLCWLKLDRCSFAVQRRKSQVLVVDSADQIPWKLRFYQANLSIQERSSLQLTFTWVFYRWLTRQTRGIFTGCLIFLAESHVCFLPVSLRRIVQRDMCFRQGAGR